MNTIAIVINYNESEIRGYLSEIRAEVMDKDDLFIWLNLNGWLVEETELILDELPLVKLVKEGDENRQLLVKIDRKNKLMHVLNDVEFDGFS